LCHLRQPEGGSQLRFAGPCGEARRFDHALLCGIARGGAGLLLSFRTSGSSSPLPRANGEG
jgi:hypothetical protein